MLLSYFGSLFAIGNFIPTGRFTLPEKSIINYEIDNQTRKILLSRGYTLVKLKYSYFCDNCFGIKDYLERKAFENKDQMLLQEILTNNSYAIVEIESPNGYEKLEDPSIEKIKEVLCELMLRKPYECLIEELE